MQGLPAENVQVTYSIHDRPSLAAMLAPGRKSHDFHRAVTLEVHRLTAREDHLTDIAATSVKRFVKSLATEAAERVSRRRDALLRGSRKGRPHG